MSLHGMKNNVAVVLHKKGDLRIQPAPIPSPPGLNQVLLKTSKVGICGSDVSYWVKGYIGSFVVEKPLILGHETCARVVAVGDGVKHLLPGDRVAIEPGIPCRRCTDCKEGNYNLCRDIFFSATPPDDGTLTRYFTWAADYCHRLPDHVSDEEGALMEPLSVAIHACTRANITGGHVILICGAGPIGLTCILTARAFGVTNIAITDINANRLETAKTLGANHTILLKPEETEEMTTERVINALGSMPDCVLECCGFESSIRLALQVCKSGGTVLLIGMGPSEVKVPLLAAACREVDIKGCFRYKNTYPKAINLIASGQIDLKPIVTHRYRLDESLKAFEMCKSGKAIKVIIDFEE